MVRYSGYLVSGALDTVNACMSGDRVGFNNGLNAVVTAMKKVNSPDSEFKAAWDMFKPAKLKDTETAPKIKSLLSDYDSFCKRLNELIQHSKEKQEEKNKEFWNAVTYVALGTLALGVAVTLAVFTAGVSLGVMTGVLCFGGLAPTVGITCGTVGVKALIAGTAIGGTMAIGTMAYNGISAAHAKKIEEKGKALEEALRRLDKDAKSAPPHLQLISHYFAQLQILESRAEEHTTQALVIKENLEDLRTLLPAARAEVEEMAKEASELRRKTVENLHAHLDKQL